MKKTITAFGIALFAVLTSLALAGPASAVDYGGQDSAGGVTPGGVSGTGAGVLPATGGPETLMLVGGVLLLVVGAVALFVSRRRANA